MLQLQTQKMETIEAALVKLSNKIDEIEARMEED